MYDHRRLLAAGANRDCANRIETRDPSGLRECLSEQRIRDGIAERETLATLMRDMRHQVFEQAVSSKRLPAQPEYRSREIDQTKRFDRRAGAFQSLLARS